MSTTAETEQSTGPVTPRGLNHLVLNVRDIEESEAFWCGLLGFKQVGVLHPEQNNLPPGVAMRFYSGADHHHDLALMQVPGLPAPKDWSMFGGTSAVSHVAVTYPDQASWKRQVEFLRDSGVHINLRIDHGMTHSVYITDPNGYGVEVLYDLPREIWEHDVDGALNYAVLLPTEGDALTEESERVTDFAQ